MQQPSSFRQNKSLPSSLFKTAIQFRHKNQQIEKKQFHKTANQPFNAHNLQWHQSSTSLTRDKAPSHRIPKALRFCTLPSQTVSKKGSNILHWDSSFLLSNNNEKITNKERGVSFAKSTRPEHFVRVNSLNPSPSAYNQQRFMDGINYKTQNSKLKTQTTFKTLQIQTPKRKVPKGLPFSKFENYHKKYLDHSKHRPYQPEDTMYIPGPGFYKSTFADKKKQIRYSFKKDANRFKNNKEMKPAPCDYYQEKKRVLSLNAKGTIPKSCRNYLTKFNETPSPAQYEIPRFLEFKNKE